MLNSRPIGAANRGGTVRRGPIAWFTVAYAALLVSMLTLTSVGIGTAQAAESKRIIEWFPNPQVATLVANQLGKGLNDVVDQTELNSIETIRAIQPSAGITSLSELAPLHGLKNLDVQQQEITGFEGMANFPLLESLNVTENPIVSLAGIEEATSLTAVSLGYNYAPSFTNDVAALAPLEELSALRFFSFRNAHLTDAHLEAVSSPTTITSVNLSSNEIASVAPLTPLVNVDTLYLVNNKLTDLTGISNFTKLTSLSVQNDNFGQGHNEAVFGVGTNGIIDYSEVNLTPGTPNNRTIWMDRNSATMDLQYLEDEDLYVYDLSAIKPPVSSKNKPYLAIDNTRQGAVHNIIENRIEISPADFANIDPNSVVVEAVIRNPLAIMGRLWLFADEAPATYSVTYVDGVDGEAVFADQVCTDLAQGAATPAFVGTPERTGYTFAGWSPSVTSTVSQDATYVAQWTANQAALSYFANGATAGTTAPQHGVTNGVVTVAANGFLRPGYSFTGWNTSADGTGTAYEAGKSLTLPAGGMELFAQWAPDASVLFYDGNGSTAGSVFTTSGVTDGEVTVAENGFDRPGYLFTGWNTEADGSGIDYDTGSKLTLPAGSMTLFAQWTASEAALVFDGNGATGGATATITGATDDAVKMAENGYVREGYSFVGWNTQADGGGVAHAVGADLMLPAGVTTVYAQWLAEDEEPAPIIPEPENPTPEVPGPETPAPEAALPGTPAETVPAPQPVTEQPSGAKHSTGLALTGANSAAWLVGAAVLSLGGGLFFLLARRKTRAAE